MSVEENKELVRKWVDGRPSPEWLNDIHEGKITKEKVEKLIRGIVERIFSPDVVVHIGNISVNREAIIQGNVELLFAMPDEAMILDKIVAEGDLVAIIGKSRGTFLNPYQGIPSTGKTIEMGYSEMFRIADGKIVEVWLYADTVSMMQQMGITQKQ